MSYYNWEQIFKQKSDKELIDIFKSKSHLGFEAEYYAIFELRIRNVDISDLKDYLEIKVEKLKVNINEFENLSFKDSKHFKGLLVNAVFVLMLIIILINKKEDFLNNFTSKHVEVLYYLSIAIIGGLSGYINYFLYKKNLKKIINHKKELLKKVLNQTLPLSNDYSKENT